MANQRAAGKAVTTISVDETLLAAARAKAAAEGTNLSAAAAALLRRWVDGKTALEGDT